MIASTLPAWVVIPGALLAGFAGGTLSALLGIGGSVVTTPAVRLLGGTPIQAVGSTVPAILPGAMSGAWRYSREGLVQWRVSLMLGIPGSVLAVVGALASDSVNGRILMVMTAGLMLWAGITVLHQIRSGAGSRRPRSPAPGNPVPGHAAPGHPAPGSPAPGHPGPGDTAERSEASTDPGGPNAAARVGVRVPGLLVGVAGAVAGFSAGLLGVGGGIILVPVLSGPLRLPIREAVASSLVAVAAFQVPALVTHVWLGHVDWAIAAPLALGVVPGAQLGARLNLASSDRTIRALFGALVVVLAVIYGITELRGLLSAP